SVRDEIFECSKEKGTEPPFLPIGARIAATLDQVGKKTLGSIRRVLTSISFSAQETVHRTPINPAQFRERIQCVSGSCRRIARFEDQCPTRGSEQSIPIFRFTTQRIPPCFHQHDKNDTASAPQ